MDGASRQVEPPVGGMKYVSHEDLVAWLEKNYCFHTTWTNNGNFIDIHLKSWHRYDFD